MPVSIHSRLLLLTLTLTWVLPALVAGLWMVDLSVQSRRRASETLLRDTARLLVQLPLPAAPGLLSPRELAEFERVVGAQRLPAWLVGGHRRRAPARRRSLPRRAG